MNKERFDYIVDRIKQAKASGETDTRLVKVLAKWDFDIPVGRDGKWLLEGFIMTFKRDREILSAIDPSISPDLPPHLMDPVQIAHFFSIPLEEMNWMGPEHHAVFATRLERIEGKLDEAVQSRNQPDAEYVSIKRAAKITSLSYSHIRRAILAGELTASNNGGPAHPIYRIARKDLVEWMKRKRAGAESRPSLISMI